jgi:tetratricopeptide (TPR) repeat protein
MDGVDDLELVSTLRPDLLEGALLELAEELCRRAEERHDRPTARVATLKLAAIRRARGELAEAALLLEGNLAHEPQDDVVLAQLAELYATLKRPEALARVCISRMKLLPDATPIEVIRQLSALVPQLAQADEALSALNEAHARQPERDDLEQALIDAHGAISDHGALARLWIARGRRAADTPERVECLHQAAKHMVASGATESALHLLQRIQSARPEHVDVTLTLTETLLAEHRHADARALLESTLERRSDLRPAQRAQLLMLLSRVTRAAGDRDAALGCMQAAREADKTNRTILAALAILAEELEAWDVAERALIALLLLKRSEVMPRGEVLLRRARVALQLTGAAQALIWARKAQEAEPDSPEIEELIAQLQRSARGSASGLPTVH